MQTTFAQPATHADVQLLMGPFNRILEPDLCAFDTVEELKLLGPHRPLKFVSQPANLGEQITKPGFNGILLAAAGF